MNNQNSQLKMLIPKFREDSQIGASSRLTEAALICRLDKAINDSILGNTRVFVPAISGMYSNDEIRDFAEGGVVE
jgi:hypothetical protein